MTLQHIYRQIVPAVTSLFTVPATITAWTIMQLECNVTCPAGEYYTMCFMVPEICNAIISLFYFRIMRDSQGTFIPNPTSNHVTLSVVISTLVLITTAGYLYPASWIDEKITMNIIIINCISSLHLITPLIGYITVTIYGMCKRRRIMTITKHLITDANTDTNCCICMTAYEIGESVITLICGHKFHKKCLNQWFEQKSTCPLCIQSFSIV